MVIEHVCARHLNKRMQELLYNYPNDNIADTVKGVKVTHSMRGGGADCVVCGKNCPDWELEYTKSRTGR